MLVMGMKGVAKPTPKRQNARTELYGLFITRSLPHVVGLIARNLGSMSLILD